jgi:rare lipoprotein A
MKLQNRIILLLILICSATAIFSTHVFEKGIATYYGTKFNGKKTSSGELHYKDSLVCAHRTLPFGTVLLVTNTQNNKTVKVRVNDRGPFIKNRIIDLSNAAADSIDMIRMGQAPVELRILFKN